MNLLFVTIPKKPLTTKILVMGRDQNLRELSMNLISCSIICGNREIREKQIAHFSVILSEKLANLCVISREIAIITGMGHEQKIIIKN